MDRQGIKNQSPFVYIQQTPKSKHKDRNIERGIKISLCFFINLGRLVKLKESIKADKTIQNQERVPLTARLQIKQTRVVKV